ncbi:Glutamate decarboxylase 1 [Aphelenchoides fujianensis]|nr:Glutamate decarboxylase 1 [Aphelenchoides fujianensis]
MVTKKEASELLKTLVSADISPQHLEKWDETVAFLQEVVNVLLDYIKELNDRSSKILEFHHPDEVKKLIDLSIPEKPLPLDSLLKSCQEVLKLGVKTGHPRFFNQISCGLDLVSMAGEWLTATANTNMFTYEISPLYILMEKEVMRKMIDLIGWPADKGDGTFTSGGAIANMYAMNVARHQYYPPHQVVGMSGAKTLCCFISENSHYSIKGSAATLGIGADYCFCIESDKHGRMIPEALEKKIVECKKEGLVPFFVVATAGTTVYGAFDPLPQIADICDSHKLWFHVDAAWGGGLLLSPEHRHKLSGIDRASSVTWNPHKLMGCLLQCSACFIKQDSLLFQCNQMSADYLFQQDKPYDVSYDTGDKVIQCGRHNDFFKFWLMWRSKPEFLNICFWYVPPSLRHLDLKEKNARLEKIAPKIKARMMERGTTMVGYQPDKQRPNFFRIIISNQAITEEDLDFLVDEIVEIGHD